MKITDDQLDILATAQSAVEYLWPRLNKLGVINVNHICKLRHRLETEDGFIPTQPVLDWLGKLVKEIETDEKYAQNRSIRLAHLRTMDCGSGTRTDTTH